MTYFKISSKSFFLLFFTLFLWLLISFSRTTFNIYRLISNESSTLFLSNKEKEKVFHMDLLTVSQFVEIHTDINDSILLKGDDGELYFFLRYQLFPQRIYWVSNVGNYKESPGWKYVLYTKDSLLRAREGGEEILRPNTNIAIGKLIKEK